MKKFMDENFLLDTGVSQELYFNHAAKQPIIDYHCHLDPKMVAKRFLNAFPVDNLANCSA